MRALLFILLTLISLEVSALINGTPLVDAKDVVRIKLKNGWVCSGVFIDPFTILTAAHCVFSKKHDEKLQIEKIESANNLIIDVKVKRFIPHPSYSAQLWHSYDVGVLKTSLNSHFKGSFPLQEIPTSYSEKATLMGCGRADYNNKIYSRMTGENRFIQIGAILLFVGESNFAKSNIGINVTVAPNDSGGPIVQKETGRIIGVMTTTTLKKSLSYGVPTLSTGTSTTVKENLKFIKDHLGEDLSD